MLFFCHPSLLLVLPLGFCCILPVCFGMPFGPPFFIYVHFCLPIKKKKKKKINMTISDVPYHILLIMIIIYFCDF